MTDEEKQKRSDHPKVRELKEKVCTKDSDKKYLFVSYKSDDWKIVLTEIVYKLVNEYGLNVYFDGSFDDHNDSWLKQMPDNMNSYKCVGVLAFLSEKYSTSYATLMELMHSQTFDAAKNGLPIIPVNLEDMLEIDEELGDEDTGLGVETFPNGRKNINASDELKRFKDDYDELYENQNIKRGFKVYKGKLSKRHCSTMIGELLASKGYNTNMYNNPDFYNNIVNTIKNTCGEKVFSEVSPVEKNEAVFTVPVKAAEDHNNGAAAKPPVTTACAASNSESNAPDLAKKIIEYPNGDVYKGEIKDGKPNGQGKLQKADGTIFKGEFYGDPQEGKGTIIYSGTRKYSGEWSNGVPNGQGIMEYSNKNNYFKGSFKNGSLDGENCEAKYDSGNDSSNKPLYMGSFQAGKPARCKVEYPENSPYKTYIGELASWVPNGQGTMTFSNGDVYEGEWKDGKPNGQGIMNKKLEKGKHSEYKGNFINGKLCDKHGVLTYYKESGERDGQYEGEFENDIRNGHCIYTPSSPNGTLYDGEWKDNKKNGHGILKDLSGNVIYEGEFKDGKPCGQ